MTATNIHIARLAAAAEPEPEITETLPRLREVTNDPQREYVSRGGEVAPLPDSVAALILSKCGRRRVERHQIIAAVDGTERAYSAPGSMTIAEHNGTSRPVLWVGNRRDPSVIHILADDGRYIETLPLKGEAQWFSQDEASQAAIAAARGHIARDMERLSHLHAPDAAAERDRLAHNAAQTAHLVQTFPAPAAAPAPDAGAFPKAGRAAAAIAEAGAQRERHTSRQRSTAAREASAVRLGSALRAEVFGAARLTDHRAPIADHEGAPAERWDELSPAAPEPTNTQIETW